MAKKNTVAVPYSVRHGRPRSRVIKGHPKRTARQRRAYARGASKPGDQPNPAGSKAIRRAKLKAA